MKKIISSIVFILSLFLLVGCTIFPSESNKGTDDVNTGTSDEPNSNESSSSDDVDTSTSDESNSNESSSNNNDEGFKVTFETDSNVDVYIYFTQDYSKYSEQTNVAYARDSDTGEISVDGTGQVNFAIEMVDNYELNTMTISGEYKNLKGPADTGRANTYRITKIESDLTVTITTKRIGSAVDGYKVDFVLPNSTQVMIYPTQELTGGVITTTTLAKDGTTGLCDKDGSDQVNFKVILPAGYVVDQIYTNNPNTGLKTPVDTGVENTYRVTKINCNTTITITIIEDTDDSGDGIKPIGNISGGKDYYDEMQTIDLYDDLFDLNNKVELSFDIDKEQLYAIEEDYQRYIGHKCNINRLVNSLTIKITYPNGTSIQKTIEEVGIRMKGNTTRHSFCNSDGGIFSFSSFKISFQETFDDTNDYSSDDLMVWSDSEARNNRKNRTFFGLSGLELKFNAEGDLTYSRDIYSALVYRQNGIYAQSTTLGVMNFAIKSGASINYSGSLGVYKVYEPIDRIFIKRYFPSTENDGDLYKATWGEFRGMPDLNHKSEGVFGIDQTSWGQNKYVSYELKTNKSSSTQDMMRNLLAWINGSSSDLNSTLVNYIDEDYFVTWVAIMYLTGDWDNFMYDSNNYYLYFNDSGIAYFMPYDMDRTYGIAANNQNMVQRTPLDKYNLQGSDNRSRLLTKTIDVSNSKLQKAYLAKIKELSTKIFDYNKFTELYNTLYNNYCDDIYPTLSTLVDRINQGNLDKYYNHIVFAQGVGANMKLEYEWDSSVSVKNYFINKQNVVNNNC